MQSSGAGLTTRSYSYNALGNLTSKSDVGTYTYPSAGSARPHAVSSITGTVNGFTNPAFTYDANGNLTAGAGRTITYTAYNAPASVSGVGYAGGTSYTYTYTYNAEHERVWLVHSTLGTFIYLHPAGKGQLLYEKEVKPGGLTEHKHYITAGSLLVGAYLSRSDSTSEQRYFHQDHLGSLTLITNAAGAALERLAYDAFGKRRYPPGTDDPNNGLFGITTDRGFTSHEHLDEVALIHMNGRIYDPVLARFVTADPFIQFAGDLQSYNRYTYVHNNPLGYVDPSGYGLGSFFKKIFKPVAIAAIVYFTAGAASGALISSATSSFIAGTGGLSTAFVTLGGTAGSLTALGTATSWAAGGFVGGLLSSGGDVGFALKSGIAVGLTAGLGQYGMELAGTAGSVGGRSLASGLSTQAFGGNFADGVKNGLLGAIRSEAYAYMQAETDKLATAYWDKRGGMNYDDSGSPWTYGNRGCADAGKDVCASLLKPILMPIESRADSPMDDSFHKPLPFIGRGLGEIPVVGTFLNAISKAHDFGNQVLTGAYDTVVGSRTYGGGRDFGIGRNTVIDAVSTATMLPAAAFTARALYSNPLSIKSR